MSNHQASHAEPSGIDADGVIAQLHSIDGKVSAMSEKRLSDPDTLGDKIIKLAIPSVAGLLGGKLFQLIWDKTTRRSAGESEEEHASEGVMMSILFAALSAAFGAVISQLSDRGSQAFVSKLQRRREQR